MPHDGYDWRRITASQNVHVGPVTVGGLILAADGVGTADVTIYDGRDAGGREFGTFRTPVDRSESHGFPAPAHFEQGIFITIGSNVEECIVLYRPQR